jgi:hypothetical protein
MLTNVFSAQAALPHQVSTFSTGYVSCRDGGSVNLVQIDAKAYGGWLDAVLRTHLLIYIVNVVHTFAT